MKIAGLSLACLLLAATTIAGAAAQPPQRRAPTEPTPSPPAHDCTAQGALPSTWQGQAYAIDGATLAAVGLRPHLRIWGIQVPELRDAAKSETVPGMRARAALEDLLGQSDHKLKCRVLKLDGECRVVAQCSLDAGAQSIDVGGALIAAGMAYGFRLDETLAWEPKASQRYGDAEYEARKARRGLWPQWLGER